MTFNPSLGGRAPGHLRDEFTECVEEGLEPSRYMIGQLWNCTDTVPGGVCDELEIERGSSYAQAVRSMRLTAK